MSNTGTSTAGHLPATLEAKINAYQDKALNTLRALCQKHGISGETYAQVSEDLVAFLHYTGAPLRITRRGFKEIKRNTNFIQSAEMETPLAIVLQSYADIEEATEILSILQQTDEPSQARQLSADYGEAFMDATAFAQAELLRRENVVPDEKVEEFARYGNLVLFMVIATHFSGATAEELLQVEPRGLNIPPRERERVVRGALRTLAEHAERVHGKADGEAAAIVEVEAVEIPDNTGEPTQGLPKRYIKLRQGYTRMLSRPLPVSCVVQPQQSLGAVRIRDLMQVSDLFKAQADKFGISETRLYQSLDALQYIAQAKGTCRFNAALGYNYYDYELTLANFVKQAAGREAPVSGSPSGSLTAEFWTALYILSNIYIAVDEEVIIDYITDKDSPDKKKPITKGQTAWIKVLNVPMITTPTKPKERSAYNTKLVLEVHNFVKEGRTKEYILDGKLRRNIKIPVYHLITEEEEKTARRLFKGSAAGIRFYHTLLSCPHKNEEDLLEQVFDYQKKRSKSQSKEEYERALASINKNKGRDKKKLAQWFDAAIKGGILESAERYATRDEYRPLNPKPIFVWRWKRKNPNDDGVSAEA